MSISRNTVFRTNPNKDFLRSGYDAVQIQRWFDKKRKPLKYLGLPAWEMLDIIAWEKFLGRFTTIEREENQQHLMFLRANVKDLEHRLHSLYGEFDDILIRGQDAFGNGPDWPYDLVNLDYFGGFLYSDLSRPKALKKLIRNQSNYKSDFLLIITQHIRDCDTLGEKQSFLVDLRRSLDHSLMNSTAGKSMGTVLDWYADPQNPDAVRQALYLNMFLRDAGEAEYFDVFCNPAILYSGTGGAVMIHFLTQFLFRPGISHKVASSQAAGEVIAFPVKEIQDGLRVIDRFVPPS